jgi:DNA recombination protein RmuC
MGYSKDMTTYLILALFLITIGGFIALVIVMMKQISGLKEGMKNDTALGMIKQDLQGITSTLNDRMDKSSASMNDAISRQFAASSRLIGEVTRDLTELKESNKQVLSITDELKLLQNTLQNPKQRGVLGEYFLQSVLENVLPPDRFELQYRFKDGDIVDALIKLDNFCRLIRSLAWKIIIVLLRPKIKVAKTNSLNFSDLT